MFGFVLLVVTGLPTAMALAHSRGIDVPVFAFNAGSNSLLQTSASVICGNVGIGTFVAFFLFTGASPVIGASLALASTLGLLVCALLARRIHDLSRMTGAYGLVDLIVETHGVRHPLLIWLPVATIFLLRILIQLLALALILGEAFGLAPWLALVTAATVTGLYVVLGGYKTATETDVIYAALILVLVGIAATGVGPVAVSAGAFFDLGPYTLFILVGIFFFLPFGTVLGVDNWQRISTAESATTAVRAYLIGTLVCGLIYALVVLVALMPDSSSDVLADFRQLMPVGAPWLADILFACAIISSIDTFTVPLVSTFARKGLSLAQLRMVITALFAVVAGLGLFMADILSNMLAAFNSLAVVLPAILGAFLLRNPRPEAAIASLFIGVGATFVLTQIDENSAAPAGFALSGLIYWTLHRRARIQKRRSGEDQG